MKSKDLQLLEEAYTKILLEYSDPHMGKLFKVGDDVMLKHASIEKPTGIHAVYKPGDLFEVVGRIEGTSPTRRFYVKAKDTGKVYSVHGYHIQQANKPLGEPVVRVSRKSGVVREGILKCANCKKEFSLDLPGMRHRDHCPYCLCSVHIDQKPGDRSIWCGEGEKGSKNFKHSILKPIAKSSDNFPSYILYQCEKCGKQKVNVQAVDDNKQLLSDLPIKEFQAKKYTI